MEYQTLVLRFPKSITMDDLAPACQAYRDGDIEGFYTRAILLIAEDEQGNKMAPQLITMMDELIGKLAATLNKPVSSTPQTTFSYPPEARVYIKAV